MNRSESTRTLWVYLRLESKSGKLPKRYLICQVWILKYVLKCTLGIPALKCSSNGYNHSLYRDLNPDIYLLPPNTIHDLLYLKVYITVYAAQHGWFLRLPFRDYSRTIQRKVLHDFMQRPIYKFQYDPPKQSSKQRTVSRDQIIIYDCNL